MPCAQTALCSRRDGREGRDAWRHQQSVCEEELLGRVAHVGEREEAGAHERAQHIGALCRVCRFRHLQEWR
eukprot:scaffold38722_cov48-Phaeocystis_antarctica.AAC.1